MLVLKLSGAFYQVVMNILSDCLHIEWISVKSIYPLFKIISGRALFFFCLYKKKLEIVAIRSSVLPFIFQKGI